MNKKIAIDQLIGFLLRIGPMSPELQDRLRHILKYKEIKKGDYLLRQGEISNRVYFILKGLFRGVDMSGDYENSIWFMVALDVMFGVSSFYTQEPSEEGIEALEDSIVLYVTYDELLQIYKNFPEFNLHGRLLTEKYYQKTFPAMQRLRIIKDEDRYLHFLKTEPELAKTIPAKYLSSFLGMSTATFYRVRSSANKKR